MIIKIKNKEHEVKFTFNSFKYLQDFEINTLNDIDNKPFKILGVCEQLLFGGLNNNPKKLVTMESVDEYIESVLNDGDITQLLEELIKELEDSNFFKNLQKNQK